MSGRALQKQIGALGFTVKDFSKESKVSIPTLYKLFSGKSVRPDRVGKVQQAIDRLKAQLAVHQQAPPRARG